MKVRRAASVQGTPRRTVREIRDRLRIQTIPANPTGDTPARPKTCRARCRATCRTPQDRHAPLRQAADRLRAHLEHSLVAPDTIAATDLAAFVSALALTELVLSNENNQTTEPSEANPPHVCDRIPLAESVTDLPVYENEVIEHEAATDRFLWRRELEDLWRKHLTKDEFHRPVVRSLGLPVLVIVDHVRAGRSWKSICENYPGLAWDDIRAAVSMATECGWLGDE